MNHENKVALVCAGSKGLGKGCAEALLRDNANVIICSRNSGNLDEAREELKKKYGKDVTAFVADLTKKEDIDALVKKVFDKFGRIDILVNNIGGPKPGSFFDMEEADWQEAHNRLLMSVIRLNNMIIPKMTENGFGRIINITSMSVKEPTDNLILSDVYRSGIVSLSKAISKKIAKDNVFINTVCPGMFNTDRHKEVTKSMAKDGKTLEESEAERMKDVPIGRAQEPMELGELVNFLASDKCRITGTAIQIDGGVSRGLF